MVPILFYIGIDENMYYLINWCLLPSSSIPLEISLLINIKNLLFLIVVLFIRSQVFLFRDLYIEDDPNPIRFKLLVSIFIFSIVRLVLIPNAIFIIFAWDGLGLSSFLLVSYYARSNRYKSGIVTVLTNRIGDLALLLFIIINLGDRLIASSLFYSEYSNYWSPILLLIAAITKSAQLPFSTWLPAAIAAPTPVSALVHSSTLVTAGVYLLYLFYPTISFCPTSMNILLVLSLMTINIAGLAGIVEIDLKKVIALSTLSQLGVMIFSLAIGNPDFTFFHLITHAFFKRLIFLAAGVIITHSNHFQDIRALAGSVRELSVPSSALIISSMALCGIPFLSGFYRKDLIIEFNLGNYNNLFGIFIVIFATGITAFYSIRLLFLGISTPTTRGRLSNKNINNTHLFLIPLSLIAVLSGCYLAWLLPPVIEIILPLNFKVLTLIVIGLGLIRGIIINKVKMNSKLRHLFSSLFFITPFTYYWVKPTTVMVNNINNRLEKGWIIWYPNGIEKIYSSAVNKIKIFRYNNYLQYFFMGLGLFLFITTLVWFL